jgi:hypothetical protein
VTASQMDRVFGSDSLGGLYALPRRCASFAHGVPRAACIAFKDGQRSTRKVTVRAL